jgi:hypothetical protein
MMPLWSKLEEQGYHALAREVWDWDHEELLVALDVVQDDAPPEAQLWAVAMLEAAGVLTRPMATAALLKELELGDRRAISLSWAWLGDSFVSFSSSANFMAAGSSTTSQAGRRKASGAETIEI